MDNVLLHKDFAVAENLYYKIKNNKDLFLELLDNIFDLITFIPVCVAEYKNREFDLFNLDKLIIEDITAILNHYDFILVKTI